MRPLEYRIDYTHRRRTRIIVIAVLVLVLTCLALVLLWPQIDRAIQGDVANWYGQRKAKYQQERDKEAAPPPRSR